MVNAVSCLISVGMPTISRCAPKPLPLKNPASHRPKISISTSDTPIAVIRKISGGAFMRRSRRYAIRSTASAVPPEASARDHQPDEQVEHRHAERRGVGDARAGVQTPSTANVPTMKTSEWAKLISRSTP